MGWVPEGQRSGRMSYNTSNKSATYVTIGEEDQVTYEAISASREFEDIQATMTFRLMQQMMLKEEMALLAGNASVTLAVPTAPTATAATLASSTLASATYGAQVVALTLEGYQNASRAGVLRCRLRSSSLARTATPTRCRAAIPTSACFRTLRRTVSGTSALALTTPAVTGCGRLRLVYWDWRRWHRQASSHHGAQQLCPVRPAEHHRTARLGDHRRQQRKPELRFRRAVDHGAQGRIWRRRDIARDRRCRDRHIPDGVRPGLCGRD